MSQTSLYTVAQVRAIDAAAIAAGTAGFVLMQSAATAALAMLRLRWPAARRVVVLCGSGNNGGDGYLLAAQGRAQGLQVQVIELSHAPTTADAARSRSEWLSCGGKVIAAQEPLIDADVYVDALFGTGLKRPLEGVAARLVSAVNESGRPLLALDVPSGLDADTGNRFEPCIRAEATITFVARKRGMFTGNAADVCGDIFLDTLGIDDNLYKSIKPDARLVDAAAMAAWLPARQRDANKGKFGHVLAIGGDLGTAGAIRLAGEAALRVGAGLVSVATQPENISALNSARPELMAHAVGGPQELEPLIEKASVIALGPGLGQRAWGHALWRSALRFGKPVVIDADALNLLAREPMRLAAHAVLTPHPGEAARLLGCDTAAIAHDRYAAVRALVKRYGACVVLKGAGSLIANMSGEVAVCPFGNPGMASGGMGDVMTGVIAGLMAQGLESWPAAQLGVTLHAQAGDIASRDGQAGTLASDLFAPLRQLRNHIDRSD